MNFEEELEEAAVIAQLRARINSLTVGAPPSGPAGGDLGGTYPNPTVPALTGKEDKSAKGAANGYAPLDSGLLVPVANLPKLNAIPAPVADVSLASHKLTNVLDPTLAQDAATKNYVDTGRAVLPRVLLVRSTTQTLNASSITAVSWSAAADAAGAAIWAAGSPTVITIPEDGWYAITAGLLFNNTSGDHDLFLAQSSNSGNRFAEDNGNEAEVTYRNIAVVRHFPAAFTLSLFAFQNSVGASTMGGTSEQAAHLAITKLPALA